MFSLVVATLPETSKVIRMAVSSASGAAAASGDVATFTTNVIELTEQLGIPVEQVQLPPSGTPYVATATVDITRLGYCPRVAIATTLTIGATAFTADLAQLADVLNVPLPQVEQAQPEQLPLSD